MVKLRNGGSMKGGISAGMFGMREKWKKVSRAASGQKKNKTTTSTTMSSKPASSSPTNHHHHHSRKTPIDSRGGSHEEDIPSDGDMVSVDLRTPPMNSSKKGTRQLAPGSPSMTEKKSHSPSDRFVPRDLGSSDYADSSKSNSRTASKETSMMTPDMLEILGLTEVNPRNQTRSRNNEIINSSASTRMVSNNANHVRNSRQRETSKNKKTYDTYGDTASCLYFADNDTKTTSDSVSSSSSCSSETFEPEARDPCPFFTDNDEDDEDNNTCMQLYRDSTGGDCDPITCVGVVLAMPVACGMLCIDNILDTNFFDAATQSFQNNPSEPEPLIRQTKRSKHSARKKRQQRDHRKDTRDPIDDDDDDDDDDAYWGCDSFLNSAAVKIIAL